MQIQGVGDLPEIEIVQVYDRAALEGYLTASDAECERLRGLIEGARMRLTAAERAGLRSDALVARVGGLVLDAHDRIAAERAAAEKRAAELLRSAQAEAARIVDAAHAEAAALGAALGRTDEPAPAPVVALVSRRDTEPAASNEVHPSVSTSTSTPVQDDDQDDDADSGRPVDDDQRAARALRAFLVRSMIAG